MPWAHLDQLKDWGTLAQLVCYLLGALVACGRGLLAWVLRPLVERVAKLESGHLEHAPTREKLANLEGRVAVIEDLVTRRGA